MFTDLVGSTELASRLDPEVADRLRQTHFALLRGAIAAHGGTEVKNLGDGLMVVFSITSGALNCAVAMQQAIAQHNKRAADPLSIRVGMSLGEVTKDEGDYFGDAVVEAARLCAHAKGDQILAAQLVQLAAGRRARQDFVHVGDLELKGIPSPLATVEVDWKPVQATQGDEAIPLPSRCAATPAVGFVGRSRERALLDDALKKATGDSHQQIVLIGGEPGVGKTTLAAECARAAHTAGAIVLFGRSDEDLAVPYGPWAEALTHLVSHAPEDVMVALTPFASSLVRLAPALAGQLDGSEASALSDPEAARYMLFGGVASALRSMGEIAPVVLVLDDLQWADSPSLQLLRHLATSEPIRLLVIGTFRESDVAAGDPLADLIAALHREQGTERISLRGLGDLELLAMMEGAAGQKLGEDGLALRDALIAETDGNPFFVGELLRHLVETGGVIQVSGRWVASAELRTKGLPISVREVVGRRVSRLGDLGTKVLSIASVIGRDFELSLLATVSDLDEDTLLDVLDKACEAALIENVEANRYTFVHALIEHTLYDSVSPTRRGRLHRSVAEAIEAQVRDRTEGRVAELAYHWARASVPDDLGKAVCYAKAAGDEALARLAPTEALRWYTQALTLLDHQLPGNDLMRCELLVGLGDSQRQNGNPEHRQTLLDAARMAQELQSTGLLVAAVLANHRGFASEVGFVDAERVAALEAACRAVEGSGSSEEAKLLALLASELTFNGDFAVRKGLADRAMNIARSLGDPATLAEVVTSFYWAVDTPETLAELRSLGREASEAAHRVDDPVLQCHSASHLAMSLYQSGDIAGGDRCLSEARSLAERLGQPQLLWSVTYMESARALLGGDTEEAERLAFRAFEIGTESGQPDAAGILGSNLLNIRYHQGRLEEVVDLVSQSVKEDPGLPAWAMTLAMLYCDLDRPEDARAVLEPFAAENFAALPKDGLWLPSMVAAADVVTNLAWSDPAQVLLEQLRPFSDQIPGPGSFFMPEVSHYLGLLSATLGRYGDAETYFAQAVATHERIAAPWSVAMTQLSWGRCLSNRGGTGDLDRASVLMEEALKTARERGYRGVERRAKQALDGLHKPRM